MLPDDYENLAQSVIASSAFSNNILQCITTKNYWDVVNLYKPLMHLWYVGVLMQSYLALPLLYILFAKRAENVKQRMFGVTVAITIVSFTLYFIPSFSAAWKFYYLPFRLFEITSGGLLVFRNPKASAGFKKGIEAVSVLLLLFLLCARTEIISGSFMLVLTVFCSLLFIWSSIGPENKGISEKIVKYGAEIGKRSYSIYIWHQVIVAYLFYSFFPKQSIAALFVFLLLTTALSILSFRFIEIPLEQVIGAKKKEAAVVIGTAVIAGILLECQT